MASIRQHLYDGYCIAIGAAIGLAGYVLLKIVGISMEPAIAMLVGASIGLLWASVFFPPKFMCGLRKGIRYRVVTSFSSRTSAFREGELVIFEGERRFIPDPMALDTDPQQDLYDFVDTASHERKLVSSVDFATPNLWVKFLEEVPEKGQSR